MNDMEKAKIETTSFKDYCAKFSLALPLILERWKSSNYSREELDAILDEIMEERFPEKGI